MDLFKRTERIQLPTVSIALDDHSHRPFRPGSRVTGTITLHSSTTLQLQHSEAIFFGRAVTHCTRIESAENRVHRRAFFNPNGTIHYHDDACLFRWTQPLSHNSAIEGDRNYTWRFDFTFGQVAKLVGRSPWRGPTVASGIYAGDQHPLPPTFERYFNDHHYAFVEYRLQAVFQFSNVPEPVTMHLPLFFFPTARWPDPSRIVEHIKPPETFSSRKLLADSRSSKHSIRDSLSSDGPSVEVVLRASLHTEAIASSTTPIYVCVEIRPPSSPAVTIPSVALHVKSVTLYQVTMFRARQDQGRLDLREYQEVGEDGVNLHASPESITAEAKMRDDKEDSMYFYPATFELKIPDSIAPSFNTFNINNNYQAKVTVEANIRGREFKHSFFVESFIVLPPS